mgnify:CR=1 FL=1|tara:strand:- start:759 stop:1016 length:258 start_codon:yes stop_codon:yes gene_type:complete
MEDTTHEIYIEIKEALKQRDKQNDYVLQLEEHIISSLFYLYHTQNFESRTKAFTELKRLTKIVHSIIEEEIDTLEDPYADQVANA